MATEVTATSAEERYFIASQRQLVWRKFKRHRLAVISASVLIFAYLIAFSYEFVAPTAPSPSMKATCMHRRCGSTW